MSSSTRHQILCKRSGRHSSFRPLLSLLLLILGMASSQSTGEEIVMEADPFLLRIAPRPQEFSLEKRVTVLFTVENIVREYFEEEFKDSTDTLYLESGITGLSILPPEADTAAYETIKFLGGAVAFHPASTVTPSKKDLQKSIKEALRQDSVKARLQIYFPQIREVIYVPLVLGNRGIAVEEEDGEVSNDNTEEPSQGKPDTSSKPASENNGNQESDAQDRGISGIQASSYSRSQDNARKTTIGLSTGVALGGALIVLLIALLIESRRRRMELWRESGRSSVSSLGELEEEKIRKDKPPSNITSTFYADDEQETTLRLPRIWGVSPSQRMEARTLPGPPMCRHHLKGKIS